MSFVLLIIITAVSAVAVAGDMICSDAGQGFSYKIKYDNDGSNDSYKWDLNYKGIPSKGGYRDDSQVELKTPWTHLAPSIEKGVVYDNFTTVAKVKDDTEVVVCRTTK